MLSDITITDWCPSSNMAQGLGSDGSDGDDKYIWKHVVAAELNDGQGNKMSMTEVLQLLAALKNSQQG